MECDGQEHVAGSFSGYLDALEPDFLQHFDWFVAPSVTDFQAMKARLERALGKAFELESGDLESGVFSLVARFGRSRKNSQSFTMQPNRAKRTSIRTNHPWYEELKGLHPGYAPMYPELPPDSYQCPIRDDTAGEFARGVGGRGLPPPRDPSRLDSGRSTMGRNLAASLRTGQTFFMALTS